MELISSKKWFYLGFGALLILGLRWINMHWMMTASHADSAGFSYEMPRPSYAATFDLSGREMDREVLKDEEAKAKATTESKTAVDRKKAAEVKAKAKKEAELKAQKNHEKKKRFDVSTIEAAGRTPYSVSDTEASASYPQAGLAVAQYQQAGQPASKNPDQPVHKYSASEWRSLLNAQPTTQLADEFITSHQSGDILDKDYYTITFELFADQSTSKQSVGNYILSKDRSTVGFSYMASEYGKINDQSRAMLWKIMLGYGQQSQFGALSGALSVQDSSVVSLALQVLGATIQNQKQISTRSGTDSSTAILISPQAFQVFLAPLAPISKSNDPTNAPLAQSLISDIQMMSKS